MAFVNCFADIVHYSRSEREGRLNGIDIHQSSFSKV